MAKYLLLLLCALVAAWPAGEKPPAPAFEVTPAKADDVIAVTIEGETAIVDIRSMTGIGGVAIELTEGAWPQTALLRLRYLDGRGFDGLECFTLDTARLKVEGARSDAGKMPFRFKDDKGKVAAADPPAGVLNVAFKSTEQYLELALPAHLLTGSRKVEVGWIDFYR